jgi:hypothetical protein
MMLLDDAFPNGDLTSQSELMRAVKDRREQFFKQDQDQRLAKRNDPLKKLDIPAEAHYAWHASPREIEAVLNAEFTKRLALDATPWKLAACATSKQAVEVIEKSLELGAGFMALIWDATLHTKHPHWVVVERHDDPFYRVLDPAVTGLPERVQRYETIPHKTRNWPNGPHPLRFCSCLVWRDERGDLRAAEKIWIHKAKLEELMDEGAARAGGLRYLIVRALAADQARSRVARTQAITGPRGDPSFAERVREMDLRNRACAALPHEEEQG